jgi:hypothetical protein
MAGIMSGFGSPISYGIPQTTPWGISPQFSLQNPLISQLGSNPYAQQQPLHQVFQLLQTLPQQLQQLQQLAYLQQQQLQQLLQVVPTQLVQLQQLIQAALQQTQQPFGQLGAAGGLGVAPWAMTPQAFGAQPGQIM